ncbi:MAG: hypothetical protein RMA76_08100 [Deltaproteobacteria bacterium]|jgi:hypothetical protein
MLVPVLRVVLLLVALFAPGGLFVVAGVLWRRHRTQRGELDFDGTFRRVPDTRRGRHSPILVRGT